MEYYVLSVSWVNSEGLIIRVIVTATLSSVFLFALDQTIVADVQPNIIAEFGSIYKLPWLSVSFLLGIFMDRRKIEIG